MSTHPASSCNWPHLEICAPKSLRPLPSTAAPLCYPWRPFRLAAVCFVGLHPASGAFAAMRLAVVRLAAIRFASLRLAGVAVATDSLHRLLSSHVFRSSILVPLPSSLFRLSSFVFPLSFFVLLGSLFVFGVSFLVFRCWCFVLSVSCFVFRVSSFLFALCYLIFSSFFSPISTYYINYVFAEGGKGTGDGSVAAARIGTTARGGTFGGAHTQRQGRRPGRVVYAGARARGSCWELRRAITLQDHP